MPKGHAVVDGSNIATEGRSEPSLKQLREAVSEFEAENNFRYLTVIVDASFEHRVSSRERKAVRAAIDTGEIITPPAGVVGRGDAFILEVADRAGAVVLSNDSFQEFHGTYPWLFDDGRLVGGKPVPGVGWVYVPRTPVRGPVSRRATTDAANKATKATGKAAKAAKAAKPRATKSAKTTSKASRKASSKTTSKASRKAPTKAPKKTAARSKKKAPAAAETATAPAPDAGAGPETANTVATWRAFRHDHPVGSEVEATVERYSSHGAYGSADGAVVYFPNRLLGDPPPNRARDAVELGTAREFLVQRFDDERRGIDLGLVPVSGTAQPAAEPVKKTTKKAAAKRPTRKAARRPSKKAAKKAPTGAAPKKAKGSTKGSTKGSPKRAAKKSAKRSANKTT